MLPPVFKLKLMASNTHTALIKSMESSAPNSTEELDTVLSADGLEDIAADMLLSSLRAIRAASGQLANIDTAIAQATEFASRCTTVLEMSVVAKSLKLLTESRQLIAENQIVTYLASLKPMIGLLKKQNDPDARSRLEKLLSETAAAEPTPIAEPEKTQPSAIVDMDLIDGVISQLENKSTDDPDGSEEK